MRRLNAPKPYSNLRRELTIDRLIGAPLLHGDRASVIFIPGCAAASRLVLRWLTRQRNPPYEIKNAVPVALGD